MLFDGTDQQRLAVTGLIEWAECGSEAAGYHVVVTLTTEVGLSFAEIAAFQANVRDRVAGVVLIQHDPSYTSGTRFCMTVTEGNATIEGARRVLEEMGGKLSLELTIQDRENKSLHETFILAMTVAGLLSTQLSDLFGYGYDDPYARLRRRYYRSPWNF